MVLLARENQCFRRFVFQCLCFLAFGQLICLVDCHITRCFKGGFLPNGTFANSASCPPSTFQYYIHYASIVTIFGYTTRAWKLFFFGIMNNFLCLPHYFFFFYIVFQFCYELFIFPSLILVYIVCRSARWQHYLHAFIYSLIHFIAITRKTKGAS